MVHLCTAYIGGFTNLRLEHEMKQFLPQNSTVTIKPDEHLSALTPENRRHARTIPATFVPLRLETRTHVSTAAMCWHLGREQQTARGWACYETYPEGLRPIRVMGRLAWPVAGIRMLLGQQTAGGALQ